jgi:predicted SprT family Zn-dependent metalloprotease
MRRAVLNGNARHSLLNTEMIDENESSEFASLVDKCYTEFNRINTEHFHGKLCPPQIEFSKRKTYGGYYQKRLHRIVLSWQAYREHGWTETLNTLTHEIAHIVYQDHSPNFWALAVKLGVVKKYAANPLQKRPRRQTIYTYSCPACGKRYPRRRKMQRAASCASCCSTYNPKYKLVLVEKHVHEPTVETEKQT